jgi:tRNA(Ile)-lysidine synthase
MNKVETIVRKYIIHHDLFKNHGRYIVALSGGADSVALLLILKQLGVSLSAAHCNFHLRGEESERDEQFCVSLCERLGITLHRIHFDTQFYALQHKVSIEMAARDLRYRYFAQLAKDIKADGICVAHHRDDNVETVILNLLRGSGVDGLAGIAPKNGNILRPLLCISRQDILDYLQLQGQNYVTDSTNLEDDALRNRIRHHVIPLLETINPAAKENIAQTAKYLRQAKMMLEGLMGDHQTDGCEEDSCTAGDLNNHVISLQKQSIIKAPSPEYMLHSELGKYGFHGDVIDDIYTSLTAKDGGVGKVWKNGSYMLAIDWNQLLVTAVAALDTIQSERPFRFPEEGNFNLGKSLKIKLHRYLRTADFTPSKSSHLVTLDADKVSFPLTYRLCEKGDRFYPFGMKGSKLISDYLTDRKRNVVQKMKQHVITDSQGEIIWLIGERTSDRSKITDQTQIILEIELVLNNEKQ